MERMDFFQMRRAVYIALPTMGCKARDWEVREISVSFATIKVVVGRQWWWAHDGKRFMRCSLVGGRSILAQVKRRWLALIGFSNC
jgi:hypothetical protein